MVDLYYIEDDPNIAAAVKEYLRQKNVKGTIFGTLEEARRSLEAHVPSLVLLDWNMPDGQGDCFCRWIRSRWKELPILFLTVRGDSKEIVSGFENGADDYVVKPFELGVLYARIQAVLRRTGNVAKQYLSCDGIRMDLKSRAVFCGAEEICLSASEYEVLLYLMLNQGKTVTRDNIIEHVWDEKGNYVNDNTLTVTMKRLRDKLHQPPCLKTIRSVGYRMEATL